MYSLYTEEELDNTLIALVSDNETATLYDIAGHVIAPKQKSASPYKLIQRNFKDFIVPYLRRKAENLARIEEKVERPFARREQAAQAWYDALPAGTPRQTSLVDVIQADRKAVQSMAAATSRPPPQQRRKLRQPPRALLRLRRNRPRKRLLRRPRPETP